MQRRLLDLLACPIDNNSLRLDVTRENAGIIHSGSLTCNKCYRTYQIKDKIPQLILEEELELHERYWENDPTVNSLFMRGVPAKLTTTRCRVRDEAKQSGDLVLDVGCGTCIDYPLYIEKGMYYVGMDITQKLLLASETFVPNIPRVRGNALKLPFKDSSFDNVYCKDFLVHLGPNAYKTVLAEMWRTTKKKLMIIGIGNINTQQVEHHLRQQNKVHDGKAYGSSYPKKEIENTLSSLTDFNHLTHEIIKFSPKHQNTHQLFVAYKNQPRRVTIPQ